MLNGTYPKITRTAVEVKHQRLGWCADLDGTEILGVELDVLSGDLT